MHPTDPKPFSSRFDAVGCPQNVFAELAECQEAEVSRHRRGFRVSPTRVERMVAAITALEDLVGADPDVRIDLSSVQNIKAAQKRLAEIRKKTAVVPWQFCGAVAKFEAGQPSEAARATLSGATSE